ncbi:MAG: hypothetical protein GWM98_07930 [Nitrospinaceae bacterium]|nr:hypothetical protein [Nitrospinaceae bacterium]NIY14816.1 hypothetical protein [Nitrospinaceae bacterium]
MQRAATISLVAHVAVFLFIILLSRTPPTIKPVIYNVNIVTPEPSKPERKAPPPRREVKKETTAAAPLNRQRVAPKPQNRQKVLPKKKTSPKPEPATPSAEEIKAQKLRELQEQRKRAEELKAEKLRELEEQKRLDAIRKEAAQKGLSAARASDKARHDKVLAEYAAKIQALITERWVYPDIASVKKLQASIVITVLSNGAVRIGKFEKPSGNNVFDRSCLKAINDVGAVPPPPFGEPREIVVRFIPDE